MDMLLRFREIILAPYWLSAKSTRHYADMAERLIAAVLKTVGGKTSQGSNPCVRASLNGSARWKTKSYGVSNPLWDAYH